MFCVRRSTFGVRRGLSRALPLATHAPLRRGAPIARAERRHVLTAREVEPEVAVEVGVHGQRPKLPGLVRRDAPVAAAREERHPSLQRRPARPHVRTSIVVPVEVLHQIDVGSADVHDHAAEVTHFAPMVHAKDRVGHSTAKAA